MWIIYGRENCVWCDRAKALLTEQGVAFSYEDLSNKARLKTFFTDRPDLPRTVPQVYDPEGRHIGGYTELAAHLAANA